jgi:hypothetical protein
MARFLNTQAPTMLAVHFFHVDWAVAPKRLDVVFALEVGNREVHILGRRQIGRRYQLSIPLRHSPPLRAAVSWAGVVVARRRRERPQQELSSVSELCLPCQSTCLANQSASMLTARLGLDTRPATVTEVPRIHE